MANPVKKDKPTTGDVLCRVWLAHADRMRHLTDKVVDGRDTEVLHDFRVALRATRALWKLFASALPDSPQDFSGEFRWLAKVTGPVRDLDVILRFGAEQLPTRLSADTSELAAILGLFQREHERAQTRLQRALRSRRYLRLMDDWQIYLRQQERPMLAVPSLWYMPMHYSSAVIVLKRSLQLLKMGRRIDAAADLHRMRIRAKRLRYLLQALQGQDICLHYAPLLHPLTHLQSVLGKHHDAVAMRERLLKMSDRSRTMRAIRDVLSRWIGITETQQGNACAEFGGAFDQLVKSCDALH